MLVLCTRSLCSVLTGLQNPWGASCVLCWTARPFPTAGDTCISAPPGPAGVRGQGVHGASPGAHVQGPQRASFQQCRSAGLLPVSDLGTRPGAPGVYVVAESRRWHLTCRF